MSHIKSKKNYGKILNSLNFTIKGLPKIPRAPDGVDRDLVDVYMAKRRLKLAHVLPEFNIDALRFRSHVDTTFEHLPNIDRNFLSSLMEAGCLNVIKEIAALASEEFILLSNPEESGRNESFTDDPTRVSELVHGLIACSEAEKTDKTSEKVRCREALGEKMILLGDFWLARKMLLKAFSYLEYYDYDSNDLDKLRVEIWCVLSYVCIYNENSQEVGYDLPSKCLSLARQVCQPKWHMPKTVMSILIPKPINVYGLKNQWIKIQADYVNMNSVVTTLSHVLCVKKAKYWQDELQILESLKERQLDKEKWIKDNIVDALTSALALADEVAQYEAFIATALKRGLFFEEQGDWERAMEDFNALHILSRNYDDKESTAMAMNRMGQSHKVSGNVVKALEHFINEYEISCENEFEELIADSLQDLGFVLLEEGHTWEADECISQANEMFYKTKQPDTPNNLDELSWAMMGVARGQHLWGRYSTLIRTQEKSKIDAIYEWKMSRKCFPLATMPKNWYKTETRQKFDQNYADCMPDPRKSIKHAKKTLLKGEIYSAVQYKDTREPSNYPKRRLFEFAPVEVKNRSTVWFNQQGYQDMFAYINASAKPRDLPTFIDDADLIQDSDQSLEHLTKSKDDQRHKSFTNNTRKTEAQNRASRMVRSTSDSTSRKVKFIGRETANWVSHDFRNNTWKQGSEKKLSKLMDPSMGIGERLGVLLEDMQDLTSLELDKESSWMGEGEEEDDDDDDRRRVITIAKLNGWWNREEYEGEDESEDPELTSLLDFWKN